MAIGHDQLQDFLGMFVGDLGATVAAGNAVIGHNIGLCEALAGAPATAGELAGRTGAFVLALGALKAEPRITEAFRTGGGVGWHEHDHDVFAGCERFSPGWLHA